MRSIQAIVASKNDYHIDCQNLSHRQQQSHSGLTSLRRILWCYHSNEISQTERLCSGIFFIGFYKENFEFFRFIFFTFLPVHVRSRVKGWISFLSFLFFFRASPYGWVCRVVSTKTPLILNRPLLEYIALPKKFTPLKECNRMVKQQSLQAFTQDKSIT